MSENTKDNIKVVVKVRPLIAREIEEKLPYQWRVKSNTLCQLDQNGKEFGTKFTFDKVYDENTKTIDVYDDIAKPIVEAAVAGINGTIFAYGQTSSGKTYTMTGTEDSPGIIKLAVLNLFDIIKNTPDRDFLVRVSYIEIYNETLRDLLDIEKETIKIQETLEGIKVDATEKVTSSPEEVLDTLKRGEVNRQTGSTNMNEESSRSHSIFKITIESREHMEGQEEAGCVNVSQLNLVDLAGSERSGQTGATGKRFKEGTHINKSLSALALVIKQLSENPKQYKNYRDSKLTRILQNSLGGNAKTSIICAVTPAAAEETASTLQFGNRAKNIKNEPVVNEVANSATMIQELTKKLGCLQSQLESKKNLEKDNYNLQKQIAGLRRLILSGVTRHSTEDTTRRKHPQRRITISTLSSSHSVEGSAPIVPRFCTPVLKYNPLTSGDSSDFSAIQRPSTLSSVPEEPPRLITPPPSNKRVNFENEIIELDTSKTPPCILRKSAKQAERNLKDIVELTDRERMYPPKITELLSQLEEKTCIITTLQDEIDVLKQHTKEKDFLVEFMKKKIQKSEETVKEHSLEKQNLEEKCKDFEIKNTDWEVSYETLKKKAKLREEELLSTLDELRNSKGTSLNQSLKLNCDKDLIPPTEDNETQTRNLLSELQSQLAFKTQTIIELEANLVAKDQRITFLEKSSQELQDMIESYKEKLSNNEEETSFLKSTVETLNSTIKSQKTNLDNLNDDIKSYNSVIQELQSKATSKEIIQLNISVGDDLLQNMIENEEKLIANNENIKNIIHAFKNRLEERNKEISTLKSALHQNVDAGDYKPIENITTEQNNPELMMKLLQLEEQVQKQTLLETELSEKLETKNNELSKALEENEASMTKIVILEEQIKKLTEIETELSNKLQTNNNELSKVNDENLVAMKKIVSLEEEIKNRKETEEELSKKFTLLQTKHDDLSKILEELRGEKLNVDLREAESKTIADHLTKENAELKTEIESTVAMVTSLQEDINENLKIISSLQNDIQVRDNLIEKVKSSIDMLKELYLMLSNENLNVSDESGDFAEIIKVHDDCINCLTKVVRDLDSKAKEVTDGADSIKTFFDIYAKNTSSKLEELQNTVDTLEAHNKDICSSNTILNDQLKNANVQLNNTEEEMKQLKSDNEKLVLELSVCKTGIKDLELELAKRNDTITNLKENLDILTSEKNELSSELSNKIDQQQLTIDKKQQELADAVKHLNDTEVKSYRLIENLINKVSQIATDFNISNQLSCELDDEHENTYEKIVLILEKITNHITFLNTQINETQQNDLSQLLWEAKKEITELTQENIILSKKVAESEEKYKQIVSEMQNLQADNDVVTLNLTESSELLGQLKDELKQKSDDIDEMKTKVLEWKNQFEELDIVMKEQQKQLKLQSDNLLRRNNKGSDSDVDSQDENEPNEKQSGTENALEKTIYSPKSLVTICCGKMLDYIKTPDSENTSSTCSEDLCYNCSKISLQLLHSQEENTKLTELLRQLQATNKELLDEHEQFRLELHQLIEPASELQKKIINHKTNLSILTATTYAENKLLNSQVKSLQHHHSRFHQVCQRDIPAFKKQLCDLLAVLKNCPTIVETENGSLKRFSLPDVLDKNTTLIRNESVLDGDLLMLDTNITLTTADNTLVGCDQTCLDLTQNLFNEVSVQTNDINQTIEGNDINSGLEILYRDNNAMFERIELLKEENKKLRQQLDDIKITKTNIVDTQSSPIKIGSVDSQSSPIKIGSIDSQNSPIKISGVDSQSSPIKISSVDAQSSPFKVPDKENSLCEMCISQIEALTETNQKLEALSAELVDVKEQNTALENKYQNLLLEIPSTDALVLKLNSLEKENLRYQNEIKRLTESLNSKSKKLNDLQVENDTLSNQVMESITENDNLNKEIDDLKRNNETLSQKCTEFEKSLKSGCSQCLLKDTVIQTLQQGNENNVSKVNSSDNDFDTSRRYNKICTLQSELNAGKEDCKELCEDFTSIKNHLEFSSMSMDLDESIDNTELISESKSNVPKIPEVGNTEVSYETDKMNCLNYYQKIVGSQAALNENVKIIDVMKMLCNHLLTNHGNEIENLVNKLKNYEQDISDLKSQLLELNAKHLTLITELEDKTTVGANSPSIITQIKSNLNCLSEQIVSNATVGTNDLIDRFKEQLLAILDTEFSTTSIDVFEIIIGNITNKHQIDLDAVLEKYNKVQEQLNTSTVELKTVNDQLVNLARQLADNEKAYNLLNEQKENIHKINGAITLDLINKEKELNEIISKEYQKLCELNLITQCDINPNLAVHEKITTLFDSVIEQHKVLKMLYESEKKKLSLETNSVKTLIHEKEKEISDLKQQMAASEDGHNKFRSLHEELTILYNCKVDENTTNLNLITKLMEEIDVLKLTVVENEKTIQSLSEKDSNSTELIATINNLRDDNHYLKVINNAIIKKKEAQDLELKKLRETIEQNNLELEQMKTDIFILNETVKDNTISIEKFKEGAKNLLLQNYELKEQYEDKCQECSRLETNIKTHEKTAEIQSGMIKRLQKQKEDVDKQSAENERKLIELTDKFETLKKEYAVIESDLRVTRDELNEIQKQKDLLECRVTEFEYDIQNEQKSRTSLDNMLKSTRRRRQSLHDSKRLFGEQNHESEENNLQAVFETRDHPDDLFMDVDDHDSNRSSPIRLSKGRDSFAKSDHSEFDEDNSRPNSVMATRRKRHSVHDFHRSIVATSANTSNENPLKLDDSKRSTNDNEVSQLKEQLVSCQKELDDLKERYKELDDECETCAEYLRERDEQCARLKKEKTVLERQVSELQEQLRTLPPVEDKDRRAFANVAVNTDEDWANLHSVVVDRMSYDAEVEKNRRLVKTIEDLRFKKQELKNINAKMQKALEKYSQRDKELELKQKELEKCKIEIVELKQRNKELDDECGMCAEYLKEKDEHYKRLKETKLALEAKLAEYHQEAGTISHLQSVRKKRQSLHDQNRTSDVKLVDAATEISDDFLSNLVERDHSLRNVVGESHLQEIKQLKTAVHKLTDQKIALEKQVALLNKPSVPNPTYVATGSAIVQNQQITDVMKENQKLKKINAKLVILCKKRDKTNANRENEDPSEA